MGSDLLATLGDSQLAFLVMLIVGSLACKPGIAKAARLGLWTHPLSFAGYLLGAAALVLCLQGLFRLQVLPIAGGTALMVIVGIMIVKAGLATLYPQPKRAAAG